MAASSSPSSPPRDAPPTTRSIPRTGEALLDTLRGWKKDGTVCYIGVTHHQLGAFAELERIVCHEDVDFVQLPCSIVTREAEARLLPAAAANGVAVLVMRPFQEGALFARLRGRAASG